MTVNDVAAAVAERLGTVTELAVIRVSSATEGAQLLRECDDLGAGRLPAAIVTPGAGRPAIGRQEREQQIGVLLIDRLRGQRPDRVAGAWELYERVMAAFPGPVVRLPAGVDLFPGEYAPAPLGGELAGVMIEFNAKYKGNQDQ